MTVWEWPQWVIAGFIIFVLICQAAPANDNLRGLNILIWVFVAWVLWMGGFWS